MEYSIGDLSKITRVSGKTLHKYHQEGLVVPSRIDKFTRHRYYDEKCLHRVEIVRRFHKLGIPSEIINDLLAKHKDTKNLIKHLQTSLTEDNRLREKLGFTFDKFHAFLQTQSDDKVRIGELEIKILPDVFAACDRFRGKSDDINTHHINLLKICGSAIDGKSITLFHDDHQFEDEMDLECCLPVKHKIPATGITFRNLPGTKAVSVIYEGPLESIWMGYRKIIDYLNKNNLAIQSPSREVHLSNSGFVPGEEDKPVRIDIQFLTGDLDDPTFSRDVSKPGFGIDAQFDL
jgi:DNA-binding transcriptional MerR regulator/effector-binding domain-containing protein